ncbi:MAG TPA: PAS domain S-box protein [Nannocystis sp.]|jgi:rsbT co-antagonist protein RsbR
MDDDDDLRRALARLERRERHRREHSSLASIELDAAGEIVAWNREAEQLFGWTAAEIVGRSYSLLVPEASRAPDEVAALLHGDRRHINVRKDGRTIACEWSVAALEHDGVVEVHCEVHDVSAAEVQRQRQHFMQALLDRSPLGIFAKHPDGRYLYANEEFARSVGLTPTEVIGRDDFAIFHPDIAASLRRHDAELLAADVPMKREDAGVGPDSGRTYWSLKFPLREDGGELLAICGIVNDITSLRQAEQERSALQQQVIASQRQALAELSTPLMPVAEGVLVMPLIGGIDRRRAEQIMEALLTAVVSQRARTVVVDITGVHSVDTEVAQALVAAATGVRLLGSRVILSGIKPAVAQTLVDLGVDLGGLVTLADLRTAVARALQRGR